MYTTLQEKSKWSAKVLLCARQETADGNHICGICSLPADRALGPDRTDQRHNQKRRPGKADQRMAASPAGRLAGYSLTKCQMTALLYGFFLQCIQNTVDKSYGIRFCISLGNLQRFVNGNGGRSISHMLHFKGCNTQNIEINQ